jgi:nicotinamide mononucleotide adenylyltransferase
MTGFKSFSDYLVEETKEVVFTFGRFNPPTVGHEKLIAKVASVAKGNNYRVYASQSSDPKKNPLDYATKIKVMRKMFPKHGRNIILDKNVKNALEVLVQLYDQGFTKVTMVVGSDRVNEFTALTNKYNGQKLRHGFYNFEDGVNVVSAGF